MCIHQVRGCEHARPETLSDFVFWEARLMGISGCYPTMATVDPFRPGRTHHHITRYYAAAGAQQLLIAVCGEHRPRLLHQYLQFLDRDSPTVERLPAGEISFASSL
jgi:hypothetical protein